LGVDGLNVGGNIGIGTTNPVATLSVHGTCQVSSYTAGNFYSIHRSSITQIPAQNTYYVVKGTTSLETESSWFQAWQSSVAYVGAVTRKFYVRYTVTFTTGAAITQNTLYDSMLYKNGVARLETIDTQWVGTSGPTTSKCAGSCLETVATNDTYEVRIQNETGTVGIYLYNYRLIFIPVDQ